MSIILGSSGAGKTTLFRVLRGTQKLDSGEIRLDGVALSGNSISGQLRSAYVAQDDLLLPQLTVYQTVMHAARMRYRPHHDPSTSNPVHAAEEERAQMVAEVLHMMSLTAVAHTPIDRLSGGQRRRTSIAVELVSRPRVLFCDEITTGLDATTAVDVMRYLGRAAAASGITIVCILHQPRKEILALCPYVTVLAKGGRCVYSGPTAALGAHFGTSGKPRGSNIADWVVDCISGRVEGVHVDALHAAWKRKEQQAEEHFPIGEVRVEQKLPNREVDSSFLVQLAYLTRRACLVNVLSIPQIALDVLVHVIAGAVIGVGFVSNPLYRPPLPVQYIPFCPPPIRTAFCILPETDNLPRLGIYICMALGLACSTIATRTFGAEKSIYFREFAAGLRPSAYVVAKSIAEVPLLVLNALAFTCTLTIVLAPSSLFGPLLALMICFELVYSCIGYLASCLLNRAFAPLLALTAALLSGLGTGAAQSVKDMGPMGYVSFARWFGEAWYILNIREERFTAGQRVTVRDFAENRQFYYNMDNLGVDFAVLILFAIVFRVLVWVLLRWAAKRHRV
jgi:ABC-type multidrug transport system ATPase subunit